MARRGSTTELAALLASLDLSAYLPAFVEDNLDDRSLVSLREGDLRALGIPATARRRFLEAVEERRHVPEALHQLRRDRDVAWAEVARLRALLRRKKRPAAISALPYGVAERRSSFSPSPPPSPAPSLLSSYSQPQTSPIHEPSEPPTPSSTVTSFFRSTSQLTLPRIDDAPLAAAPKFSPVAADAPAPASFAAVVAAPAPAREHKSTA